MSSINALVFDLCDTVVRTAGIGALLGLPGLAERHDERSLEAWFRGNPVYFAYEKGQVDTGVFLRNMRDELLLEIGLEELARVYEDLIVAEIDGMDELLARLSASFPLFALSNNNPLLWQGTHRVCRSLERFSRLFLSHRTGLLKPDPAAFGHLLAEIARVPEEVLLVDDNPLCVEQARAMGMEAIRFSSAGQLESELKVLLGKAVKTC